MRGRKRYILIITAIGMLLMAGCQRDVTDRNEPDTNTDELRFRPSLGESYVSRAGESDNSVLQSASAAGVNNPHIVIEAYQGTPGSSLKRYFSDELGYFKSGNFWDVNSGKVHFMPQGGMNLYAYFATDYTDKADTAGVKYFHPEADTDFPKLTFTVATDDALSQVDLIAAKVEGITRPDILVSFRHILSQINFGVQGIEQHQIMVKNIRINKVAGVGSFDYGRWLWTPDPKASTHNYPYYFPDRKKENVNSGSGENYKTRGTVSDSQCSYIFGDGGMFGPGGDTTFLYAQINPATTNYATKNNTITALHNSLMLMPQEVTKNDKASVTFDFEIRRDGRVVRSGIDNVIRLDDYYDWKPNYRYVYVFKFDDPSEKVTFDVMVEPWDNYNGGDGIVETEELTGTMLYNNHVRAMKPGGSYSVPIGTLTSDFLCDWGLYTLENSFTVGQQFTLSFDSDIPFANGKSVVVTPPFGFTATPSVLRSRGVVTFTPKQYSYYSNSIELNAAISGRGGNYLFNVSDAVKLGDISFAGSPTDESSLTLRYLTAYGETPPSEWQMYEDNVAVYFPYAYSLTNGTVPLSYKVYTVQGLKTVLDWMTSTTGNNPGGSSMLTATERMQTNITLATNGRYDLAKVYKSSADDTKPHFVPIGKNTLPYTGNFDGKGSTVSNLFINQTSYSHDGFFGCISSASVKHLNLTNVSVTSLDWAVGGLIGTYSWAPTLQSVTGCTVSGTVNGGTYTGAIVGENNGFVYACGSTATVTGTNKGGIAGANGGQIWSCYSTDSNINVVGENRDNRSIPTSYYVAASDNGVNPTGVTRVPSIAALNGKIADLNSTIIYVDAHFVSGNLNETPPSVVVGFPSTRGNGGVLKGTFIQNWFGLNWGQARWDAEMALLATLGMEYLVIDQVMEYSKYETTEQYMAWYKATTGVLTNDNLYINSNTALENCMKACRAHGIKLYVGTFFDKRYWDSGSGVTNPTQWKNCVTTSNRVMNELINSYFNGSSSTIADYTDVLAGWYFPYEVDDFFFKTTAAQTTLKDGIGLAMTYRNGRSDKPYLFSPFMNGNGKEAFPGTMSATEYAGLWGDIMKNTAFRSGDILSPQDCIGTYKLTIDDIGVWMPALKGAATANGVDFWINVELMGPAADATFLITRQISKNQQQQPAKLISFSYPIHYSPNTVNHTIYKAYYDAQ